MRKGRFRWGFIVVLGTSIVACGGGEEQSAGAGAQGTDTPLPSSTPAAASTPPSTPPSSAADEVVGSAPTISGEPATAVAAGMAYGFTPTARSPHGHRLTFSIANAPAWAAFNSRTGRLSGTPRANDVGTTSAIVISVHDGEASRSLAAFDLTVLAVATGSATLTWLPPTTNTDGSPLTNLSGYEVYWGTGRGDYPNSVTLDNPGLTTYVVENLAPATYYFAVKSFSTAGIESPFSAAASKRIR